MISAKPFWLAHGTHPDWRMATELVCAQLEGFARQSVPVRSTKGQLGILYFTSAFVEYASQILAVLRSRLGIVDWVGSSGYSIAAGAVEYQDEAALVVMLVDIPSQDFNVFSGLQRPPSLDSRTPSGSMVAYTALVHADPTAPDIADLVSDMAAKTESGFIFGGVSSARDNGFAQIANQTFSGGLSGVMFSSSVGLLTRVSQGCAPIGREHRITQVHEQMILTLDDEPALDVMLGDLEVPLEVRESHDGDFILRGLPAQRLRSGLLVGLARPGVERGLGFGDMAVRHVVGIDPAQRVVAIAGEPQVGDRLVFCSRDEAAARQDLMRACAELREELDAQSLVIRGAHFVSCVARSGTLFDGPCSELDIIRDQFGEMPLIGFYANGEIARDRLYSYTGVLTLFTEPQA